MKRIEFLAPVAAMRGNLGKTQRDIVYPTHDNSAYDGPEGERNTARNYQPIIVGAKRANGRSYFCVKTKTTNHLTPKAKKSMAVMGAYCAVYAAMKKDTTIAAKMDEVFAAVAPYLPQGATMRSYFMERIAVALRNKDVIIELSQGSIDLNIRNPWVYADEGGGLSVTIKDDILVKFWMQLAENPIVFTIDGLMGVAHEDDAWSRLLDAPYNVLGLISVEIEGRGYVKYGDNFVQGLFDGEWDYVDLGDSIDPLIEMRLTNESPA